MNEKHYCKNCLLFNNKENVCTVTVILEGEHYELPVKPNDLCHWEEAERQINEELKQEISQQKEPYFKSKLIAELDQSIEIKKIRVFEKNGQKYIES